MSPAREIQILLTRELRRNFRSAKGIVLSALALLGGTLAAFAIVKYQQFVRGPHKIMRQDGTEMNVQLTSDMIREGREKAYELLHYDAETSISLASSPAALDAAFRVAVWLTPLLIALIGFDAIASDLQHRSVRYWSVRARRSSYFVSKFLGLWLSVSLVTFATNALTWVVCIVRAEASFDSVMLWGLRFWASTLPITAAWCGLATLIGSLPRHPFLALLFVTFSFFAWWMLGLIGFWTQTPLLYAGPNNYDVLLLSVHPWKVLAGVGGLFGFATLLTGGGALLFARRDL